MIGKALLFLGMLGVASAACDNQCSGHGTCLLDDVCKCYDNWGVGLAHDSGDCSERVCPYELAWVDHPTSSGTFHTYAECGGRGICDRAAGDCTCFDGYEGKGCERTTCPNDCSGHGTCEFIEDMTYGATWNDYTAAGFHELAATFPYKGWDVKKTRGCVCDATYGDVDCSKRLCPYGTDVLDTRDNLLVSQNYQTQNLFLLSGKANIDVNIVDDKIEAGFKDKTVALTFRSKLNETFTTIPIALKYDQAIPATDFANTLSHEIELALLSLPNRVIDGVKVATAYIGVSGDEGAAISINVTFTGDSVQGAQHLLVVEDYECYIGCTPQITGVDLWNRGSLTAPLSTADATLTGRWATPNITDITPDGVTDFNSYECGRRGKCDYTSGLCQCFTGYTGDNCNTLTTLV